MRYLTSKEAALHLQQKMGCTRITSHSLDTYRGRGGGPRFFKIGRYVYYMLPDLEEWANKRRSGLFDSTSSEPKPFIFPSSEAAPADELLEYVDSDSGFDEITHLLDQQQQTFNYRAALKIES